MSKMLRREGKLEGGKRERDGENESEREKYSGWAHSPV